MNLALYPARVRSSEVLGSNRPHDGRCLPSSQCSVIDLEFLVEETLWFPLKTGEVGDGLRSSFYFECESCRKPSKAFRSRNPQKFDRAFVGIYLPGLVL
jgi:hypothetical protein